MWRLYMSAEGIRTSLQLKQLCWLDSGGDGSALVSDVHGNSCSLKGARVDRSAHSGGLGARVSRPAKVSAVLSMSMVAILQVGRWPFLHRSGGFGQRFSGFQASYSDRRLRHVLYVGCALSVMGAGGQTTAARRPIAGLVGWNGSGRTPLGSRLAPGCGYWLAALPGSPPLYQDCTPLAVRCTPGSACRHQPLGGPRLAASLYGLRRPRLIDALGWVVPDASDWANDDLTAGVRTRRVG